MSLSQVLYHLKEGADQVIETSCATVVLKGAKAYKIKKSVDYGFLDFTSPEKRRAALLRELRYNQRMAADIYLGVEEIGDESVLVMRRFDTNGVLGEQSAADPGWTPDLELMHDLGQAIARFHAGSEICRDVEHVNNIKYVIDSNRRNIDVFRKQLGEDAVDAYDAAITAHYETVEADALRRFYDGHVRHCHGDLHLGNILVENGRPVLFDCIEFNERLSQIDVLYDLAFLLMDLWVRGHFDAANRVMNVWLDQAARLEDDVASVYAGLKLLPLYMSVRAGVRCHVNANYGGEAHYAMDKAKMYLEAAHRFLDLKPASLTAIGGLSGSGKSTRARQLAPQTGRAPGAVVLRSDEIRKRLWACPEYEALPEASIVMAGPIAKISPGDLPRRPNIHYVGQKTYADLPAYLGGWDVALMPFAINEATCFISPTKTPEYLAGGRPVVSTPIRDVVRHYGDVEGVKIAAGADAFIAACRDALALAQTDWLKAVDDKLASMSWDSTFAAMHAHVQRAAAGKTEKAANDRFSAPGVRRRPVKPYDVVIAGAGFAGSVLAERLAQGSGLRVLVCDKRDHIGGNAYDHRDAAGILVHRYGPHIFHTNSEEIVKYLSRFTEWRPYEHRVLADLGDRRLPIPINRTTLNGLYGLDLDDDEAAAAFLKSRAEPVEKILTSRDVVINQVGRELYEAFFQGYTRKQWGLDPSELDKSVTARIPTRTSTDDRYFLDTFQAMPLHGYTRMFERMLDHERIDLALGADYIDLDPNDLGPLTIYTGPIDEFFGHRFGKLPYRSLDFVHETLPQRRFQEVAVVNYPREDVPYTRITEYKHLTGQVHPQTSICYEYSKDHGDPYYPVPRAENQALYKQYEALANTRDDVVFVGRLGTYKYYNMDQVVGQALATYRRLSPRFLKAPQDLSYVAK